MFQPIKETRSGRLSILAASKAAAGELYWSFSKKKAERKSGLRKAYLTVNDSMIEGIADSSERAREQQFWRAVSRSGPLFVE
jgi:hypothetical protein